MPDKITVINNKICVFFKNNWKNSTIKQKNITLFLEKTIKLLTKPRRYFKFKEDIILMCNILLKFNIISTTTKTEEVFF